MNQDLIDLIAKKDGENFKIHVDCIPDQVKVFAEKMTELLELDAIIRYASADVDIKDIFDYRTTLEAFDNNINERKQWIKDNYGEVEKETKKELTWHGEPIPKDFKPVDVSDLCDGTIEPSLDKLMIVYANQSRTQIALIEQLFISDFGKITAFSLKYENDKIVKYFIHKKEQNNA